MIPEQIIRQIMTMHWDLDACRCWICEAGRENGFHANEEFLNWRGKLEYVDVDWPNKKPSPQLSPEAA